MKILRILVMGSFVYTVSAMAELSVPGKIATTLSVIELGELENSLKDELTLRRACELELLHEYMPYSCYELAAVGEIKPNTTKINGVCLLATDRHPETILPAKEGILPVHCAQGARKAHNIYRYKNHLEPQ